MEIPEKHIEYFKKLTKYLPQEVHSSYMTLLSFIISGLNLLGQTDSLNKQEMIE